ncbi:MAG: response regulator transcription factor [Planctomycetota bacterium]|jgi:DNA-binding response OmpR family regulator
METVLIIEDDSTMLRGLKDNFEFKGYKVFTASDGEEGLKAALNKKPDLILLDIMLPKINGYEICRLVRQEGLEMPIIMLTAKGEESDIVLGLNLGADDYVTKPFSIKELLARSAAFLRRSAADRMSKRSMSFRILFSIYPPENLLKKIKKSSCHRKSLSCLSTSSNMKDGR